MARKAFYSFHYEPDNWRASKVRNIGVIEGNQSVSDNGWESITNGGSKAIEKWIAEQMHGKSCIIVLIGAQTAGRKWINHEIIKGWNDGKDVYGIHIHNLTDRHDRQSAKGVNPFGQIRLGITLMSKVVQVYDPPYTISVNVRNYIANNVEAWVGKAITTRNNWRLHMEPFKLRGRRIDVRLTGDQWPTEAHIRHLEMIQSIVTRMATNSFVAKGWALTVAGAIYGFAASHLNPWIATAGLLPTFGFWWLDAFYLRAERIFRCLYIDAAKPDTSVELFSLNIQGYRNARVTAWRSVLFSITLRIFYGVLLLVGVGFVIASVIHGAPAKASTVHTVHSKTSTVHVRPSKH